MSPSPCAVPICGRQAPASPTIASSPDAIADIALTKPELGLSPKLPQPTFEASADGQAVMPSPPPSPSLPQPSFPLPRPPSEGTTAAVTAAATTASTPAAAAVDWSRVRLGVDAAPTMFMATWSPEDGRWSGGELMPYGPLSLLPAAQVLNYGQSIFEGLKAYRYDGAAAAASDATAAAAGAPRVLLFRPDANAARFEAGARRMCMPPVPPTMFLAAVQAVVRANAVWVPAASVGSLYLRPLLLGTGPLLGLCPAPSYTFLVYAVPVGGRVKAGRLTALDYLIHDSLHRAAPRGAGSTKAAGNYSPCLLAQQQARSQGCHDCLYLDAKSDTYLEEGSGCNVFVAHGSVVTTPPAAGSILPGITRASLLQLAAALGYRVREAGVTAEEAMAADEMFGSGTAVVVQPIGSVTYRGRKVQYCRQETDNGHTNGHANGHVNGHANGTDRSSGSGSEDGAQDAGAAAAAAASGAQVDASYGFGGKTAADLLSEERAALAACVPVPEPGSLPPGVGPIAHRLYGLLTSIQYGRAPDPFGWTLEVDMRGPTEGPLHLDLLPGLREGEAAAADGKAVLLDSPSAAAGQAAVQAGVLRTVFADPNLE